MTPNETTPIRHKLGGSTSPITSPYFSGPSKNPSTGKRRRQVTTERQTTSVMDSGQSSRRTAILKSISSPYFESTKTPRRRYVIDSEGEEEIEIVKTPRKRRRLMPRAVTPEAPPPPSSSEELSRALRVIKPNLIQECVCDDPWKVIVATTLLNKTNGKVAVPVFWELIERWPTPVALSQAAAPILTDLLRPLGTQSMRTSRLIRLSNTYVMHPPNLLAQPVSTSGTMQFSPPTAKEYRAIQQKTSIAHLPFTGPYAIDSFRIFSPALNGGGAGARVEEQLGRVAQLADLGQRSGVQDDFDETPEWYDPGTLRVIDDEGAEWRNLSYSTNPKLNLDLGVALGYRGSGI
ncbi:Methyl-CpG-binding domain protein 4 OS=Mus musculus GN=Mbd4 PE=1 SV=1 [Rhizoctonia solani AG-1 IB]|uniref:Methyl-CpG-binding domain protein 4 n=1 Tax=Thanatephorus cucumeris (strain AG1-IB / isolate 7/3/14) TaxID=1108050 RepID=A0A0B7F566_THACB|nr:Methyl-CpG-binding domain protein 4 OS=Mus musculus GN=Mbd4 PE=1 SV=1 [Rhizoctonia solani AG-1 IB]